MSGEATVTVTATTKDPVLSKGDDHHQECRRTFSQDPRLIES
jgi:hypothetical protein